MYFKPQWRCGPKARPLISRTISDTSHGIEGGIASIEVVSCVGGTAIRSADHERVLLGLTLKKEFGFPASILAMLGQHPVPHLRIAFLQVVEIDVSNFRTATIQQGRV